MSQIQAGWFRQRPEELDRRQRACSPAFLGPVLLARKFMHEGAHIAHALRPAAAIEGRYVFVENPINRYSIGDRTAGLIAAPDGSLEIVIQRERPEGEMAANWLPAPEGPLRLALRAYLPRQQLRDRSWRVPPLVTVG